MSYTYAALHRPIQGIGHKPEGYTSIGTHPDFRHGTIVFEEPLSIADQKNWGFVDLSYSTKQLAEIIADELAEYAESYVQDAEDDPRMFAVGIGQRMEKLNTYGDRVKVAKEVIRQLKKLVS